MANLKTTISWCDATWSPVRGCSRVSPGCGGSDGGGCYAERVAHRFSGPGQPYEGLTRLTKGGPRWTGKIRLVPEALDQPLRWKNPRRIFVNSMSDLFHEGIPDDFIDQVFAVMALAPQHQFQVLTKRPDRMRQYCASLGDGAAPDRITMAALALDHNRTGGLVKRPLPNVYLGVSVENQEAADERIPLLLQTPAAGHLLDGQEWHQFPK